MRGEEMGRVKKAVGTYQVHTASPPFPNSDEVDSAVSPLFYSLSCSLLFLPSSSLHFNYLDSHSPMFANLPVYGLKLGVCFNVGALSSR